MWILATVALSLSFAPAAPRTAQLGERARAFSPREYFTFTPPKSLECADLDSDGRPDVLWGAYGVPYVYISHGLPGGDLGLPVSIYAWPDAQSPQNAIAPIAADLDLDGVIDIVCSYQGVANVGWLRGNGAGGFLTAQVFYSALVGVDPDLEVADLDGDLQPDLVIADGVFNRVVWIPGTGSGLLGTPVVLWQGQQPNRICVNDFDGDGDFDIAMSLGSSDAIGVLSNDGQGGFTPTHMLPSGLRPFAVACGDFDADGRQDLASADINGGTVSVHFAAQGSGYLPRVILAAGGNPRALDVRDIDQDGFVDLVAGTGTNNNAGAVVLWRSLGGQVFEAQQFVSPSIPARSVKLCDLDLDGAPDVLAIDHSTPAFQVAFAAAPGEFDPATLTPLTAIPYGIDLADFDEDGRLDVLETEAFGNVRLVRVLRGNGQGGLTQLPAQPMPGGDPIATIAKDFDGDEHCDALIVERPTGEVSLALGDGAGNLAPPQIVATTGPWAMTAGAVDIDANGAFDLLVALPAPSRVAILEGLGGGSFAPAVFVSTPGDTSGFDFADLDEDGAVDVLANCWPHPQIAFGDGQGGLGAWQSATATYGPGDLGLGDLNDDGHIDLFMTSANSTRWSFGAGDGTFGPESIVLHYLPQSASAISARDFDCDGHVDLAAGSSLVGILYGDGQGSFEAPLVHGIGRGWQIAFGDMNGDGRLDAVSTDRPAFAISVQLNRGPSCAPSTYCIAKLNSLGCRPAIDSFGAPSATASSGFVIECAQVRNNKNGLLFYGFTGAQQIPFLGGFLCVSTPIRRGVVVNAGGNPVPANDCSGVLSMDWNAFSHGLLGGNPAAGASALAAEIHAQWWARDQGFAPPNNHSLSDGLRFTVGQ